MQLKDTESAIKNKLKKIEKIERRDKTHFDILYSSSKAEIIINESDIENLFKSIYSTII